MDAVRLTPESVVVEWHEDSYDFPDHILTLRGQTDGKGDESHYWLVLRAGLHRGENGWTLTLRQEQDAKRHQLTLGEVLDLLPESLHDCVVEAHFELVHKLREEIDTWVFRAERVAVGDRKLIDRCGLMLHDAARLRREAMELRAEAVEAEEGEPGKMQNAHLYHLLERGIRSTKPRD